MAANAAGDVLGGARDAVGELYGYFTGLIEQRRRKPEDDMVSQLVHASIGGESVSVEAVLGYAFVMIAGGNDTVTGLLGGSAELLSAHPDQRRRLVEDPSRIPGAVEELLRLTSPVQGLSRFVTTDTEVQGVELAAGSRVHLLYGSANRDEREFGPTASDLDIGRPIDRLLTFTSGPHFCLGAAAARLQGTRRRSRSCWPESRNSRSTPKPAGTPPAPSCAASSPCPSRSDRPHRPERRHRVRAMEGMEHYDAHPARDASRASMAAVEAGDRDGWLGLFAPDALVQDPIGQSMFDPEGQGHRGAAMIAAFYDSVIASGRVAFSIRESYAGGRECANVGTITTTLPDGSRAIVEGVYTYRVDDQGRITALRAYWEPDRLRLEPPPP